MDEDLDEDQCYSRDEGTYLDPDTYSKEPYASDMPPRFAISHERRFNVEPVLDTLPVVLTAKDIACHSTEAGSSLPAAVTNTIQAINKIESAPQGAKDILSTPPIDVIADATLRLPTVLLPTSPLPRASDTAVGTTLDLPAASPRGEDWENSFTTFKAFFDGGVKILQSVDELLPLCYRFDRYATFQCAFVFSETVEVLKKFMDKYGGFMDITSITSSFSRSAALRALGLVLHEIDTMQLMDITYHKLLCWRDSICEAMALGFHVDFLLNLVRNLARAVFGARALHGMRLIPGSDEVKIAADALNLKR
ncbi:hypothetical protein Pyn_13392 [Prunus yedoensis var. nudiflora]|uniref:Uncharacterized protein n=1 Tax=Prunus yedoensis var. nudiflora TaxID=2094558 RepID=A0A314UE33_PRUYE|nr:hypothetical protein Pyn_13392 [Prunus yedoensis var. nudiflora]